VAATSNMHHLTSKSMSKVIVELSMSLDRFIANGQQHRRGHAWYFDGNTEVKMPKQRT
jgi:hypothetical protein